MALDFHSSSGRVAHFALYGKARTNGEREDISVEWVEKALAPAMKNLREAAEEAKRSAVETARVEVSNLADALTKLAALRDSGVLSEEEFAAQKAKLLT